MDIILSEQCKNAEKDPTQKKFDKLWKTIEQKQQKLDQISHELSTLNQLYNDEIAPTEQKLIQPCAELIGRLMEFFPRKTLGKNARFELNEWIIELLDLLFLVDPTEARKLGELHTETIAEFAGISVDEMRQEEDTLNYDEFEAEWYAHDEEEAFQDEGTDSGFQEDLFGFDNDARSTADMFGKPTDAASTQQKNIFSDSWLKSLFRKTAKALHPDGEINEERRVEKQALMKQLLVARDNKDIFMMLSLYQHHVNQEAIATNKETIQAIIPHLERKIMELDDELEEQISSDPKSAALYDMFGGKKQKAVMKIVKAQQRELQDLTQELSDTTQSLSNLKALKRALNERHIDDFDIHGLSSHLPPFIEFD